MNQINRRGILKGLIASPAISLLGRLSHAQTGAPALTTLNILFHGPFSFIIYPHHIEVLTPEQDDHEYTYWGLDPKKASVLNPGTFFVHGLNPQGSPPVPDNQSNVIVDTKIIKTIGVKGRTRSRILLFGQEVRTVCAVQVKTGKRIFKGKHSNPANAVPYIPMTRAVICSIGDPTNLSVDGIPDWHPLPNPDKPSTTNLHFEAHPVDDDLTGKHTREAFANQVVLLEGLDLSLDPNGETEFPKVYRPPLPDGIAEDVVCPPEHDDSYRRARAAKLGIVSYSFGGLPVHCRAPGLIVLK